MLSREQLTELCDRAELDVQEDGRQIDRRKHIARTAELITEAILKSDADLGSIVAELAMAYGTRAAEKRVGDLRSQRKVSARQVETAGLVLAVAPWSVITVDDMQDVYVQHATAVEWQRAMGIHLRNAKQAMDVADIWSRVSLALSEQSPTGSAWEALQSLPEVLISANQEPAP